MTNMTSSCYQRQHHHQTSRVYQEPRVSFTPQMSLLGLLSSAAMPQGMMTNGVYQHYEAPGDALLWGAPEDAAERPLADIVRDALDLLDDLDDLDNGSDSSISDGESSESSHVAAQ